MTDGWRTSRREFVKAVGFGSAALAAGTVPRLAHAAWFGEKFDEKFLVRANELTLRCLQEPGRRALSFANFAGSPEDWRKACRAKLNELLGLAPPSPGTARKLRTTEYKGVTIEAWVMSVNGDLMMPGYVLYPKAGVPKRGRALMAIHGHGSVEPCLGWRDDYHHGFAHAAAQAGHLVLAPELRGFGTMGDMAASDPDHWLDYWRWDRGRQFTLVSDTLLYGRTLIGQTIEDLLRWEDWFAEAYDVQALDAAGISYGGDLAITYPALSERVRSIYTSGSMGSFSAIFARCYNAPAHCIPALLQCMDRSDIAGLSAPRPIRLHYGELDTPGPQNGSASYNETVGPALAELRAIYRAFGAEEEVSMRVTPRAGHEMENRDLLAFLAAQDE